MYATKSELIATKEELCEEMNATKAELLEEIKAAKMELRGEFVKLFTEIKKEGEFKQGSGCVIILCNGCVRLLYVYLTPPLQHKYMYKIVRSSYTCI